MKMSPHLILKRFIRDIRRNFRKKDMNSKQSSLIRIQYCKILQIISIRDLILIAINISRMVIYKKIILSKYQRKNHTWIQKKTSQIITLTENEINNN